jgi:polysaccharide export outer membrane protein
MKYLTVLGVLVLAFPQKATPGLLLQESPALEKGTGQGTVPAEFSIEPTDIHPDLFFGPATAYSDHYRLGPEDVLDIRVFEMDQFNSTVRVSGDGSINLPLVGSIRVLGLVPEEAADRVAEKLQEEFVQDPQVSLFVREFNSRKVSLLGAVARPAAYPLLGRRTLLQLLAEAGGVTANADGVLYVFRDSWDGRRARLLVPLSELLVKGEPGWDIWLLPGDVVSVPPKEFIKVSVLGAVGAPGIYELEEAEASLLQALASAGGLNQRGSKKGVEIKRRSDSGKQVLLKGNVDDILSGIRPDIALQEGDVIYVNEKFF